MSVFASVLVMQMRREWAFDAKKFSNAGYHRLKDALNGRCLQK